MTASADLDERLAYLALALSPGLGPRSVAALLRESGSALAAARRRRCGTAEASRALERAASAGVDVLVPSDAAFPARLRSIPTPPMVLFARGDLRLLQRPAVAIVGSRDHSAYGREAAATIAAAAGRAGLVVTSGMARGLDAVAHHAVLDAGGTTIGVLGNGIGVVYPAENRALYERVEAHGLLLTECPPGEGVRPGAFPRRNRLISGLADVLVVVEAARGSGTMITVAAALEQGRDVMAVPGPITSPTSAGTNQLLRDGAEPLLHPDDLLARFKGKLELPVAPAGPVDPPPCTLSPAEAQVFDALSADPRHVDDVAERTGLPIGTILGVLCGLEIGGWVEQRPGNLFRRLPRRG
jgi:DNA processing protein